MDKWYLFRAPHGGGSGGGGPESDLGAPSYLRRCSSSNMGFLDPSEGRPVPKRLIEQYEGRS